MFGDDVYFIDKTLDSRPGHVGLRDTKCGVRCNGESSRGVSEHASVYASAPAADTLSNGRKPLSMRIISIHPIACQSHQSAFAPVMDESSSLLHIVKVPSGETLLEWKDGSKCANYDPFNTWNKGE